MPKTDERDEYAREQIAALEAAIERERAHSNALARQR